MIAVTMPMDTAIAQSELWSFIDEPEVRCRVVGIRHVSWSMMHLDLG